MKDLCAVKGASQGMWKWRVMMHGRIGTKKLRGGLHALAAGAFSGPSDPDEQLSCRSCRERSGSF